MLTRWTAVSLVMVGLCGALAAEEPAAESASGRSRIEVWVGEARYRPQKYPLWDEPQYPGDPLRQVVDSEAWKPVMITVVHERGPWSVLVRWEREVDLRQQLVVPKSPYPDWPEPPTKGAGESSAEAFDLGIEWVLRWTDAVSLRPSLGFTHLRTERTFRVSTGFDFDDVRRVPIDYHPESENEYREEFHPWGVFLGGKVELRVARRTHFSGAVRGRWAVGSARGRYRNTWWAWDWGRAGDEQTRYGPTLREVRLHSYDGGGRESLWMLAADVQLTWAATEWLELGGGWRWRDWGSEWQPGVIHGPFASLSMRF